MRYITRRRFLKTSVGTAALLTGFSELGAGSVSPVIGKTTLGNTGLEISRIALGTGTNGWKFKSDQTDLGEKGFVDLAKFAFDHGIHFIDAADIYGSHSNVKSVLKEIPRENLKIMTKIWTRPNDWLKVKSATEAVERFLQESKAGYFDIVLIHCQVDEQWPALTEKFRDELSAFKEKGMIKALGVSCHSLDALKTAAKDDWTDVMLARINHKGNRMDDVPEKVMPVLEKAHNSGKGVLGMKIFGCGDLTSDSDRQQSLEYVWGSGNVDAMTIGFVSPEQINDAIIRTNKILSKLEKS